MNGTHHTQDQEREVVKQLLEDSPNKEGEYRYVIPAKWWRQWQQYVHYDGFHFRTGPKPGPINTTELFADAENNKLRSYLTESFDFECVPEDVWMYLLQCYSGGPEIKRKLIRLYFSNMLSPELYPPHVKVITNRALTSASVEIEVSRADTVAQLVEISCKTLHISDEVKARLKVYEYSFDQKGRQYKDFSKTLYEENIQEGTAILLEDDAVATPATGYSSMTNYSTAAINNLFPYGGSGGSYPRATSPINFAAKFIARGPYDQGLCGLSNLGNTCFMNSALQCLMHTPQLTDYFLNDVFKVDINRINPLGMQGQIAEAFAILMKEIWSGMERAVSPRDFKFVLGKFAPQFVGFQQHDSQELLAYLLDGLHEDLNRVLDKPQTANVQANGRPDEVVSVEAWNTHLRRNQSMIVDLFQGQLKSTLVCPVCQKVSITFDPFMFLSLPLQIPKTEITVPIITVYADPSRPAEKFGVTVLRTAKVKDLKRKLVEMCGINEYEGHIALADVFEHAIHNTFGDMEPAEKLYNYEDKIYAFEVKKPQGVTEETMVIPVVNRVVRNSPAGHIPRQVPRETGFPFFVCIPRAATTYTALCLQIWKQISVFFVPTWIYNDELELVKYLSSLFTLKITNSTKAVVKELQPDFTGEPIVVKDKYIIAVDWQESSFERHLSRNINERRVIVHDSVYYQPTPVIKPDVKLTLYRCLETFTTEERLGPNDPWFCPECKEHREASKKIDLWRLPHVLVIHLKRFSFSKFFRDKIDTFVDFPLEGLDMTNITIGPKDKPIIYDLFAVSNHYGGLGGGHYTAYAKISRGPGNGGQWYSFDDSHCAPTTETTVKSAAAYVLFYMRRDI